MNFIQPILFILLTVTSSFFFFKKAKEIWRNINFGKDETLTGDKGQRIKNMILIAFGQKKMFRKPLVAFFHLCIYAAFMITQIELIEIFIDGFTGHHRIFADALGGFYTFIISFIEILSVFAFVATISFLARRNLLKIPRFHKSEMTGWPKLDGNIILYLEICLLTFIFMMNSSDLALQAKGLYHSTGNFAVSQFIAPLLVGLPDGVLIALERIGWWGHIITVFAFLNYLPYSKHLHIMLAFPNVYAADLKPRGEMENMPAITKEIQLMMNPDAEVPMDEEPPARFGAKDVFDLSWKHLLASYTCTECGRCTEACPANMTGKELSPRKIVMDVRDRVEEVSKQVDEGKAIDQFDDGKDLFAYITDAELRACTTCNACVQECPVSISPMDMILEMRRYKIMEEANSPTEWNGMFTNIENNGAPWQFSPSDRFNWATEEN